MKFYWGPVKPSEEKQVNTSLPLLGSTGGGTRRKLVSNASYTDRLCRFEQSDPAIFLSNFVNDAELNLDHVRNYRQKHRISGY